MSGTLRLCGIVFAILTSHPSAPAQISKLRVVPLDSVLNLFARSGFLRGTVYVDGTIVPLSGALVTLRGEPLDDTTAMSSRFVARYRADKNGRFSFDVIPVGQYYLEAEYPGYFSYTESVWIENRGPLTVDVELIPDYSRASLHKTGSVKLEVTNESTGELVGYASIRLRELREIIDTDVWGTRFVHLLTPGRYHFHVLADGFSGSAEDSAEVVAGVCTTFYVKLRDIDFSRNDFSCHENHRRPYPVSMVDPAIFGSITGKVIDDEISTPIDDAFVYLAPYGIETASDSAGTYIFRGLRPGTYCATARIPGFNRTTVHEIQVKAGHRIKVDVSLREIPSSENEDERREY